MITSSSFNLGIVSLAVNSISCDEFKEKLEWFTMRAKSQQAKIIVLPEISVAPILVDSGGDYQQATLYLENTIKNLAQRFGVCFCGGTSLYTIGSKVYNQAFFITPEEDVIYQPKINLINSEKKAGISGGQYINIITTPWVKLAICVCYDIEFPELVRKIIAQDVALILNPSYTIDAYGQNRVQYSAQARCIENHIFVATSCLIGSNGYRDTTYGCGCAALYSPIDNGFNSNGVVAKTDDNVEDILIAKIDLDKLAYLRENSSTSPRDDYAMLKLNNLNFYQKFATNM